MDALWIGTSSKKKIELLKFQCLKDPIKFIRTYLSHDVSANNSDNFLYQNKENGNKAQYMAVTGPDALWKNYACKILFQLNYTASMLPLPETVIQQTQSKLCFSMKG